MARTEDRTDTPNENLRDSGSQTDLTRIQGLPREKPIEVLESPTAPDYAKVQAAKELSRQLKEGDQGADAAWRRSVQVRPDYESPNQLDVCRVWVQAGTLTRDDLRSLVESAS